MCTVATTLSKKTACRRIFRLRFPRTRTLLGSSLQHRPDAHYLRHLPESQGPRPPLVLMPWGLIPLWAKDSSCVARMINARSETVSTKPAFREALKSRRYLTPADGFYERSKPPVVKVTSQ